MKKYFLINAICLLIIFSFNFVAIAREDEPEEDAPDIKIIRLTNPLTGKPEPLPIQEIIGGVIRAVLGIVGSIALAMFVYGGFVWMTSAGNMEQVQKGKNIFTWGTVGLIIIFTAYAFVRFVLEGLGG